MNIKSVCQVSLVALICSVFALAPMVARATQKQDAKPKSAIDKGNAASPAGCGLLPVSLLEKTFGDKFDPKPLEAKAPPAYDGAWGASCQFFSKPPFTKGRQASVDFMVYREFSASVAKDTFDKAAAFFTDQTKPKPAGLGDEAYWGITEKQPQLHVLKGRYHYMLSIQPADERLLLNLAAALNAGL